MSNSETPGESDYRADRIPGAKAATGPLPKPRAKGQLNPASPVEGFILHQQREAEAEAARAAAEAARNARKAPLSRRDALVARFRALDPQRTCGRCGAGCDGALTFDVEHVTGERSRFDVSENPARALRQTAVFVDVETVTWPTCAACEALAVAAREQGHTLAYQAAAALVGHSPFLRLAVDGLRPGHAVVVKVPAALRGYVEEPVIGADQIVYHLRPGTAPDDKPVTGAGPFAYLTRDGQALADALRAADAFVRDLERVDVASEHGNACYYCGRLALTRAEVDAGRLRWATDTATRAVCSACDSHLAQFRGAQIARFGASEHDLMVADEALIPYSEAQGLHARLGLKAAGGYARPWRGTDFKAVRAAREAAERPTWLDTL